MVIDCGLDLDFLVTVIGVYGNRLWTVLDFAADTSCRTNLLHRGGPSGPVHPAQRG